MSSKKPIPPSGEIRQSQIISTYGPGSLVDLPDCSVIMGGLNHWRFFKHEKKRVYEPRLEQKVSQILGIPDIGLYEPPSNSQDSTGTGLSGVNTFIFPTWFVAQVEETYNQQGKEYRTRPLIPWNRLQKGKYFDKNRKECPVVPVSFVQGCTNGHISDINWSSFVHKNSGLKCRGQLWLDEGGVGSDFADIFVRCETCKSRRPLSDAKIPNLNALGFCEGDRPWLGYKMNEECINKNTGKNLPNKLLVRSASNAYFSQTLNVISLPSADEEIEKAVDEVYENYLQYAEEERDITRERRKEIVSNAIKGFTDNEVWQEVKRRREKTIKQDKTIKQTEIETLLSQPDEVGDDKSDGDFYARNLNISNINKDLLKILDRVVLVHRLREVTALVGFTRFEPAIPDIDGELKLNVNPAALDIEMKWVPAIENKGEGIFLSFKQEAIKKWLNRDSVKERGRALNKGFNVWLERRGIKPEQFSFPGLPYIMLHSLSHLLITTLSLECGYSVSAIRERIYATDSGYGILIYTGSSASEGTLGGLVQEGNKIEKHLKNALKLGELCSNDPICASHRPDETFEERFLHGAACHGCLLIAETSCERRNEFLDRALVVETVEVKDAAFFTGIFS
jgi:hypothetical protein